MMVVEPSNSYRSPMRVGAVLPQTELRPDRQSLLTYVREVERLGYTHLLAFDHVVGADPAVHAGWDEYYDIDDRFHEPMVAFGFLAAVTSLELVTGVLILPQRETALVAKQAAEIDLLSDGRLRLGVGVGWNALEYEALGQDFRQRGERADAQIELMRRLWTERSVTAEVGVERVNGVGIAPLPVQRPIPIWVGGSSTPAYRRAGRVGDGWFPLRRPGPELDEARRTVEQAAIEAGRDPGTIGMEGRVHWGHGGINRAVDTLGQWVDAGATHVTINTMKADLGDLDGHLHALAEVASAWGLPATPPSPDESSRPRP